MNWHAIHTKPRQERQAELYLRQLSIETLLPCVKLQKTIRHQEKTIVEPLFPGYLFARFNVDTQCRAVRFARGVLNIVQFGLRPAEVSNSLIEVIKSRMNEGYVIPTAEQYCQGQIVHIEKGPLAGLEAVFVKRMKEQDRVLLLLRILGSQARLTLDANHLGIIQAS